MNEQRTILIVDDEVKIMDVLKSFLETKGFHVFCAENAQKALQIFRDESLSLILLDLMLPDIPGEVICRDIRKESQVPIIMLTAKAEEEDVLRGLEIGADDYVTKPFSLKTLHGRIEAVLRRSQQTLLHNVYYYKDLVVNIDCYTVHKQGQEINLTPNEFHILAALIKNAERVLTREILIEIALKDEFEGYNRAIDNYIKNLRHKIEDNPRKPDYIVTVHGVGYKWGG